MRKFKLLMAVGALTYLVGACAITDYSGWADHKTVSEAKQWGNDVAFSGFGADDGTYAYTVKYDNSGGDQGKVTINSYRNPVVGAFFRDGLVDVDGDDVQGSGGWTGSEAAGKFLPYFKAVDYTGGGTCEFFDNITFDKSAAGPGVALCMTTNEEIDKDFELLDSFASLDDLIRAIWSGGLNESFTLDLTEVRFNGVAAAVDYSFGMAHNGLRPTTISFDGSTAAGLIEAILANTAHGVPVALGFTFAGGLQIDMPAGRTFAFNHDVLSAMLQ